MVPGITLLNRVEESGVQLGAEGGGEGAQGVVSGCYVHSSLDTQVYPLDEHLSGPISDDVMQRRCMHHHLTSVSDEVFQHRTTAATTLLIVARTCKQLWSVTLRYALYRIVAGLLHYCGLLSAAAYMQVAMSRPPSKLTESLTFFP